MNSEASKPEQVSTPRRHEPPEARQRLPMVCWYEPGQLIRTARQVLVSTLFGQNADPRLMEALDVEANGPFRDYAARDSITVDYVSDTGDGWNSTYAVAYWCSQRALRLRDPKGKQHLTARGDVLILGGDEVYPTASGREYERRLLEPFATALGWTDENREGPYPPHPHVFAVPGNHDWYDSLVAFTRLFVQKDWFAGWQAPQRRSYFALELPHGWWLVGVDVQLGSRIDEPQLEYFESVAKQMGPGAKIILCNAEPLWVYEAELQGTAHAERLERSNLWYLEERIFRRQVRVWLAGDLHHYRRHASADGSRQKITAGGGGAFLHPTHKWLETPLPGGYALKESFPKPWASWRLTFRNLGFPFLNRRFGVLTAVLYLLLNWNLKVDLMPFPFSDWWLALGQATHQTFVTAGAATWVALILGGFLLFTDTTRRWYRFVGGLAHGAAHILAAFFLGWCAARLAHGLCFTWLSPGHLALSAVITFGGGWLVGSAIVGLYLLVSLNLVGRHHNEAFSSLAIQDYKNFLRLRIDPNGNLVIFPVGIRRVPRRWLSVAGAAEDEAQLAPAPGQGTAPHLIEEPIVVKA